MSKPIHYRVKYVEGAEPDWAYRIMRLHRECFGFTAPLTPVWDEWSWIAFEGYGGVGFATLQRSRVPETGYLARSGVLKEHRGHGLQVRLIRAREKMARVLGLKRLVSDTNFNPASARSLEKCGYQTFDPEHPWALPTSIYWEKHL